MIRAAFAALALAACPAAAQDGLALDVLYLEREPAPAPTLSNLDPLPEDEGLAGARLAIEDNATTGRFLKQDWRLTEIVVPHDEDIVAAARAALPGRIVVVNAPAADLLTLADLPEAQDALLLNGGAADDALRRESCRANVLHSAPSRAMLADALAQALVKRRWTEWYLLAGRSEADRAFADAIRRAAAKFGAEIVEEKDWPIDADIRRNAPQEIPPLTQGADHDVMIVADEADDWDRYVPYNTWEPRPVAGTEGLTPVAWAPVVEQWGAAQLQSRFRDLAGRDMTGRDYAVWAAIRAVGEGATRTGAADPATIRAYLLSEDFNLAAFKGRKMSFRAWNGQLRQPIPLVHPRALAMQAPLEGFLHQRTELDTLGFDAPEAGCTAFE